MTGPPHPVTKGKPLTSSWLSSPDSDRLWARYWADPTVERRNRLAEHYLPLAYAAAKRVCPTLFATPQARTTVTVGDLVTAAEEALLGLIARYRPSADWPATFETFATYRLVGACRDEVRAACWPRAPARRDGWTPPVVPLEAQWDDGPPSDRRALRPVEGPTGPVTAPGMPRDPPLDEVLVERLSDQEMVRAALEALPELTAKQIAAVDLTLFQGLTLAEAGRRLGVTESAVCHLRRAALCRLRDLTNP